MTQSFGVCLVAAGVLLGTQFGKAGPVDGGVGLKDVRVGANGQLNLDKGTSSLGKRALFKGGQRACVIVMGDHKPVVPIIVEVRDEKGKLVARDEPAKGVSKTDTLGNDLAAVIWYPPRDGYYAITIKNLGAEYNDCWVAIK
jgi:hypothetical protein